jgi:hypothetical protein
MLVRKSAGDNIRGRFDRSRTRTSMYGRLVGATILTAILGCSLGFAGQGAVRNADYWQHLARTERVIYIEGYTDAMRVTDQKFDGLRAAAELLHWKNGRMILRKGRRDMVISEIAPNELIEYVDKVYSDSKYHNLELVQAMRLAIMKSPTSPSNATINGSK